MSEFKLGQTVETSAHQQGLVKYVGPIHVADGTWLGIELATPAGKNDGSVRGERYFTCPIMHGLFVKEGSILRVIAQPAPPRQAPRASSPVAATGSSKAKASASTQRPRPSSVVAPNTAPRASTITKRQSVAPSSSSYTTRTPARKASTTGALTTTSTTHSATTTAAKSARDNSLDTLQTKLRHLEKLHTEDQERLKELVQTRDERDRFHGIIQKLQAKCQTLHSDLTEQKSLLQESQSLKEELSRAQQNHDIDLEDALIEREMAQERAEQAEGELDTLRSRLEERDLEVEVLREEAEMFTTEMTSEEREEAGFYRLQHENGRLRQALVALKEMTSEQEHMLRSQLHELEGDVGRAELLKAENNDLKEQTSADAVIIEHLRSQVDAAAEWEDMSNELTTKNQELEDRLSSLELLVQDLESLRELNEELELQHAEQEDEMRTDLEAKDIELAEQHGTIQSQNAVIADQENLIERFRELVFDLQGRMQDADSSRSMTDEQAKATTARFNEVMELNRRLRASDVQATAKLITSELRTMQGDEATEKLAIYTQTSSTDFVNSEPLRVYFQSKRIAAKASLITSLLSIFDKHTSYNSPVDESLAQLYCVEASYYLTVIHAGSDRLSSTMAASSLTQFADFGPTHPELLTVEKSLDHGLDSLKADSVNFAELTQALRQSVATLDAVMDGHCDALDDHPEDTILSRIQRITGSLQCLTSNFDVVNTVFGVLANRDESAQHVRDRFAGQSVICKGAMQSAKKLLKTTIALREDSLWPHFEHSQMDIIHLESVLYKLTREISQWSHDTLRIASLHVDGGGSLADADGQRADLLDFYAPSNLEILPAALSSLNHWIGDASVLLNAFEIERGPTPWSQKAEEVNVARRQSAEASVLLEDLKAEHKATLLNLHERERVLETKDLEIEHLVAKIREATSKVYEIEQLRSQIKEAEAAAERLEKEMRSQELKIATLEAQGHQLDAREHVRSAENDANSPVEQPILILPSSLSEKYATDAFRNENHWLRSREHRGFYERCSDDLANITHKRVRARESIEDRLSVEQFYESDSTLCDNEDDKSKSKATTPMKQAPRSAEDCTRAATAAQPKMLPLALDNVQTSWQPRANDDDDDTDDWEPRADDDSDDWEAEAERMHARHMAILDEELGREY